MWRFFPRTPRAWSQIIQSKWVISKKAWYHHGDPKEVTYSLYSSIYLLLLFAFHAHFSKASRMVSRFTLCDVPSCCEREIYLKDEDTNQCFLFWSRAFLLVSARKSRTNGKRAIFLPRALSNQDFRSKTNSQITLDCQSTVWLKVYTETSRRKWCCRSGHGNAIARYPVAQPQTICLQWYLEGCIHTYASFVHFRHRSCRRRGVRERRFTA